MDFWDSVIIDTPILIKPRDNIFCGQVTATFRTTENNFNNKYFNCSKEQLKKSTIYQLSVNDEDDFGGATFYVVPKEKEQNFIKAITDWIIDKMNNPTSYSDFLKEEYVPHFKDIPMWYNW